MSRLRKYAKGSNVQVTKHFNLRELECKCKNSDCKDIPIDLDHMENLELLRKRIGKPIHVNSHYRCKKHNEAVGGGSNSQHLFSKATDIVVKGMTPEEVAKKAEDIFNGLGRYNSFTHVDSRDLGEKNRKARWNYRTK